MIIIIIKDKAKSTRDGTKALLSIDAYTHAFERVADQEKKEIGTRHALFCRRTHRDTCTISLIVVNC